MVTEDYVSFGVAKLLKEKGFDWNTLMSYDKNGEVKDILRPFFPSEDIAMPTLQMAMKWLREVHHLTIDIFHFRDWKVNIKTTDDYLKADYDNPELKPSETYEEAFESAIKYCLENLI